MGKRTLGWVLVWILAVAGAPNALAGQTACFPDGSGLSGCLPVVTIPTSWTRCEADTDCVRVAWSCCDCFAGGISTAINASSMEKHEKRHRKLCPQIYDPTNPAFCPQTITCPSRIPTPGGEPEFAAPLCNERGRCEFGFRE